MSYYIENIFLCLAVPLILSMLFRKGRQRTFTTFVILGMGCCLFKQDAFVQYLLGNDSSVYSIQNCFYGNVDESVFPWPSSIIR